MGDWRLWPSIIAYSPISTPLNRHCPDRAANEPKMAAIFEAVRNKIRSAGRPVVFPEFGYIGPGLKARFPAIPRQESYRSSCP
jgi:hypothetical protein